jgi:hypothetical protein
LRGAGLFNKEGQAPRPEGSQHFLTEISWDLAYCLETSTPEFFSGLCNSVYDNLEEWENYVLNEEEEYMDKIPSGYG